MNKTLSLAIAGLCALHIARGICPAAELLLDFESPTDLRHFHDEGRRELGTGKTVEITTGFATSGRSALRFATPKWRQGMPQWPAFECDPPLTNWSAFDRLLIDITNPGDHEQTLSLFITDGTVPTRDGLVQIIPLPAHSYQAVAVHLEGLIEKKVSPSSIRRLHFFTSEAPADMDVRLDRMRLLAKGETDSPVSTTFLRELGGLRLAEWTKLSQGIGEAARKVREAVHPYPGARPWAEGELARLTDNLARLGRDLNAGAEAVLHADAEMTVLKATLPRLLSLADWRKRFEPVRAKVSRDPAGRDLVVGFATSMEKIAPRIMPVTASVTNHVQLSLARNERESVQLLAWAGAETARDVSLRINNLRGPKGTVFATTNITVSLMGYVQTKRTPPYGSPYNGWWPDPILEFTNRTDIAAGDVQSFWVRVAAPGNQPAGVYRGGLEVLVAGRKSFSFDLSIRVFDFTLPEESPLPLAITFSPEDSPLPETRADQDEWRKSPEYPVNAWRKHRARWAEFLSDYHMTFDSLYHRSQPGFDLLQGLASKGRLGWFNLGYYDYVPAEPAGLSEWTNRTLPRLREAYTRAKELGMLPTAYIYGCDEVTEKFFPQVEQAAAILKKEFPGVVIMTTTYDHTFGGSGAIKSMDAFCPLTPKFEADKATEARKSGRQVWWYICCGPHPPHANMFIELPAIDGRILMGPMTAKYRPDGFLYYQISIWNSRHCITSGPFTDWDPRSWTVYHGDGSWTCVGPDGTPLPTIRLENFRDGLEDFAYVKLLEQIISRLDAARNPDARMTAWLAKARTTLEVPESLVKSRTEYTRDPASIYDFRQKLAEAIESGRSFRN